MNYGENVKTFSSIELVEDLMYHLERSLMDAPKWCLIAEENVKICKAELLSRLSRPTLTDENISNIANNYVNPPLSNKEYPGKESQREACIYGLKYGRDFIPEIEVEWKNNIAYCNDEEIGSIEECDDKYFAFNLFGLPFYNEDNETAIEYVKEEAKQAVEQSFRSFIHKILGR